MMKKIFKSQFLIRGQHEVRSKQSYRYLYMTTIPGKPPWQTVIWTSNIGIFNKGSEIQPNLGAWSEEVNSDLFSLKERIKPFDRTELWDLAKRITNPYERIHTISSRLVLPRSISLLSPLSRSFFKMIEILSVMKFFENKHKIIKIRSLHLCEGPGGFIEALYHKAEEYRKTIQVAYGMTLRSNHQMVPGWRRATPFLQKHPTVKLIYGPSNTGDIYDKTNQEYLKNLCKKLPVHLITADGGFDFSDDFHAQEKMIFRLLVSSSLIALQTLAQEGDFVLKIFDIQSKATRDLITLIGSCFKEWTLYKPVTSRPCNSEWYFIGNSAILNRDPVITILSTIRDSLENGLVISSILDINVKEDFLLLLQNERMVKQSLALQNVLEYCGTTNKTLTNDDLWKAQVTPCTAWCNLFKIPVGGNV